MPARVTYCRHRLPVSTEKWQEVVSGELVGPRVEHDGDLLFNPGASYCLSPVRSAVIDQLATRIGEENS
ncbi:hypothetical protein [Kibdelosporangium philippinense]|uniref:hypothetical protein n=1 Tax=Kibdelosporangium philippinense TaxID=211113 RepID=UPI003620898B